MPLEMESYLPFVYSYRWYPTNTELRISSNPHDSQQDKKLYLSFLIIQTLLSVPLLTGESFYFDKAQILCLRFGPTDA